jgi:hypothetical protein
MTRIKLKESLERLQAEIDELKSISGPERTELETATSGGRWSGTSRPTQPI